MNYRELFIHAVSAACIIRDIRDGRNVATSVILSAVKYAERAEVAGIPIDQAVSEYVHFQYSDGHTIPEPTWFKCTPTSLPSYPAPPLADNNSGDLWHRL